MKIVAIPAFNDNYIWTVVDNGRAIVVDPGEATPVAAYLDANDIALDAILLTHKHDDHVGGVREVVEKFGDVPIYGPTEVSELATEVVRDGDTFELWGVDVSVSRTAGHTEEHVSFLMGDALFCGDALFYGGCGRVFTGDYGAAFEGMQYFAGLDDSVRVYAGHEYTMTNLRFAQSVEPDNEAVAAAVEEVAAVLEAGEPSLPSTIGREREVNLFLQADSVEEFKSLRDIRDGF
ncbi:hydroxyacylglutathione hydrolase [Aerococcaceae bacterium DSM 111176]|nr:hydroxyacylglutathione hydrolase [Aerococcaceae bacterium DSM 111176]